MSRFTYTKKPNVARDSFLDPIIHNAHIKLLSARVKKEGKREYIVTLTDSSQNLPEPLTLACLFDTGQRKIMKVEKIINPAVSDTVKDVEVGIYEVLGNDLDDICYGLEVNDHYFDVEKDFDVLIKASGEIEYIDLDDSLPAQIEMDIQEEEE